MKPGDAIATVAQPIARGIDYVFGTDIQNCQGCKGRQQFANALYDRFFTRSQKSEVRSQKETTMQFIVTRQIAVEAETPEEAVAKIAEGQTISLSVNPRPQPIQQRPTPVPLAPR
jgi:hypothetical protein